MSNWTQQPVPLIEGEDEAALKRSFAELWSRYPNRTVSEIGLHLFANMYEPMRGLQAGAVWSRELEVMAMRDQFRLQGSSDLPKDFKKELGRKSIQTLMQLLDSGDEKIRLEAVKEANEVAGYKPKGIGAVVNNNNTLIQNVLKVPVRDMSAEDDADFDARFHANQTSLIANARSERPN